VARAFIVRVTTVDHAGMVTHVGPFQEDDAAHRYAERIEAASNRTLRAEVLPLQRP